MSRVRSASKPRPRASDARVLGVRTRNLLRQETLREGMIVLAFFLGVIFLSSCASGQASGGGSMVVSDGPAGRIVLDPEKGTVSDPERAEQERLAKIEREQKREIRELEDERRQDFHDRLLETVESN